MNIHIDKEIRKSKFIVIESLKPAEVHTGKELCDKVLSLKKNVELEITVSYHEATDTTEFAERIASIYNDIHEGEMLTLQIDAHGDESGLMLASKEILYWNTIHDMLRPINIKLGGLLVVVLSMCESKSVFGYISPKQRAPFWAVVVSKDIIYPEEIMDDLTFWYENYDGPMDYVKAQRKLDDKKDSHFTALDAINFFRMSFDPQRDPIWFNSLVNNLYCKKRGFNKEYTIDKARIELEKEFKTAIEVDLPYFAFADLYS